MKNIAFVTTHEFEGQVKVQIEGEFGGKKYGNFVLIPIGSTVEEIKEVKAVLRQNAQETYENLTSKQTS